VFKPTGKTGAVASKGQQINMVSHKDKRFTKISERSKMSYT